MAGNVKVGHEHSGDPPVRLDRAAADAGGTTAAPDAITIVDGVFAFRPEIDAYRDLRVWMERSAETSVRRGAERGRDWAGPEAEALHLQRCLPAERLCIAEADPSARADLVIDDAVFAEPRLLKW